MALLGKTHFFRLAPSKFPDAIAAKIVKQFFGAAHIAMCKIFKIVKHF